MRLACDYARIFCRSIAGFHFFGRMLQKVPASPWNPASRFLQLEALDPPALGQMPSRPRQTSGGLSSGVGRCCPFHPSCRARNLRLNRAVQHYSWVKGPWKKALRGKVQQRDFPTPLRNPATAAGFRTFSTAPTTAGLLVQWFALTKIAELRRTRLVCVCQNKN